jgi:polyhydroxyalkanoate synthesis regulator phasin
MMCLQEGGQNHRGIDMSSITDIEALIGSLTPEEIKAVMSEVKSKKPKQVDTTRKARRIAMTELYFNNAPLPYRTNYEEYKSHAEGIRQQVLSGVDL